jgi:hypothetical protein
LGQTQAALENILVLFNLLKEPSRLAREKDDEASIQHLSSWVAKAILPDPSILPSDGPAGSPFSLKKRNPLLTEFKNMRLPLLLVHFNSLNTLRFTGFTV